MEPHRSIGMDLRPGFLIFAALALLLLPLRWILAFCLASSVHELFHILVICLLRIPIYRIRIGPSGAVLSTASMEPWQELLSAAAGPLGSFLLLFFLSRFPELALCGLLQGLYNLLPLYPADGGRILRCTLALCCPNRIPTVEKWTSRITCFLLSALGVLLIWLFSRWFWLILRALLLILRQALRKIPCKAGPLALQ